MRQLKSLVCARLIEPNSKLDTIGRSKTSASRHPLKHDQRQPAGPSFIVASRTSKAPRELEDRFGRRGNTIAEGDAAELTRSMGQGPDRRDRRVVWH
ncbi:transposase [Rhodococcus sp. NCIMB 12038]|jgi:hypothetical protein|nr:transposase [Rhodococcus sp. NCIMB 12038]